jgi:hypothetical protein
VNAGIAAYLRNAGMASINELTGSIAAGRGEECG